MPEPNSGGRRVAAWLAWWILLMSLWVAVDDSLATDELIAGAAAAALAALAAETAGHLAGVRYRVKAGWLPRALSLPGEVLRDTLLVFASLAAVVLGKAPPPGGAYREVPVGYGDDTPLGGTRRVLLTAARSLAPNGFVADIDPERGVMVVHELVDRR